MYVHGLEMELGHRRQKTPGDIMFAAAFWRRNTDGDGDLAKGINRTSGVFRTACTVD